MTGLQNVPPLPSGALRATTMSRRSHPRATGAPPTSAPASPTGAYHPVHTADPTGAATATDPTAAIPTMHPTHTNGVCGAIGAYNTAGGAVPTGDVDCIDTTPGIDPTRTSDATHTCGGADTAHPYSTYRTAHTSGANAAMHTAYTMPTHGPIDSTGPNGATRGYCP